MLGLGQVLAEFGEDVAGVVEEVGVVGAVEDAFGGGCGFVVAVRGEQGVGQLQAKLAVVRVSGCERLQGFDGRREVLRFGLPAGEQLPMRSVCRGGC